MCSVIFQIAAPQLKTGYTFTGTETTYGESYNVACATRYRGTVNTTTVQCLESGNWSTVSGCTIIR